MVEVVFGICHFETRGISKALLVIYNWFSNSYNLNKKG
jgi:hypothetical protein